MVSRNLLFHQKTCDTTVCVLPVDVQVQQTTFLSARGSYVATTRMASKTPLYSLTQTPGSGRLQILGFVNLVCGINQSGAARIGSSIRDFMHCSLFPTNIDIDVCFSGTKARVN
jgi:hypothetical protein